MDDFQIGGNSKFLEEIEELLSKRFKLSKIERKKFRFTGVDIVQQDDRIEVSMEDYAKSLEKITVFRKAKVSDLLNDAELKVYRKLEMLITYT